MCPTCYWTWHFFNNFTTNEQLRALLTHTTKTFLFISHTTNVLLFKFHCNIFIRVRIIKEMPGSVASGTNCISYVSLYTLYYICYTWVLANNEHRKTHINTDKSILYNMQTEDTSINSLISCSMPSTSWYVSASLLIDSTRFWMICGLALRAAHLSTNSCKKWTSHNASLQTPVHHTVQNAFQGALNLKSPYVLGGSWNLHPSIIGEWKLSLMLSTTDINAFTFNKPTH